MTAQLALFSNTPIKPTSSPEAQAWAQAIAERDERMAAIIRYAGERFRDDATRFVVSYLLKKSNGASSEDITDAAIEVGIVPPGGLDARAFGPVFLSLSRRGRIVKAGYCQRRKGNSTAGGILWRLA